MAGSNPFLIEPSEHFKSSFKKLAKIYKAEFIELIKQVLEQLTEDPYPPKSRQEPLPSQTKLPEGWTFHKLEIRISQGASGQLRLMYLVNENLEVIRLVWLYSHEQFAKRPPPKTLRNVIQSILNPD